jgi:UDP-N-acetylmuramoylalanine--D-glutamate ligase
VVEHIGGVENLARLGRPSVEDGLAAAAAALCIGAAPDAVGRALGSYQPDHHRLENVGELEGVRFVDDSKATNPHATLAALQSFERVVLIAGGRSKGTDLGALRQAAGRIRAVVAIGESAKQIERTFSEAGKPVRLAKSMDDAVREAFALAEPGDVVLLSPACSSFDMFNDYGHRGDVFRESYEHLADSAEKEEK